ncbi:prepilin-type N-terminal cleavage/methylation domain-containing protein [Vibrio sp. Of7-15]|uniref:GspH/FimT family pseudopilin n=1 Tax=Vibrio sp. Of7-15 TaxID=2724879 RepID=UPI001EF22F0D|nr:GspH/FimT family pseudopilin [Vibrio sp. Of7-15]MCG7499907.1 prepilin-type N-terminal cleavage/methylation domain-containing protein [Vibrio sp. Of7-15]
MVRETVEKQEDGCRNHNIYGFTLLELLIGVVVIATLISAAAPSFDALIKSNKAKRLASEIELLLAKAKSEAVLRREVILVTAIGMADSETTADKKDWKLIATSSNGTVIGSVNGQDFPLIRVYRQFSSTTVHFNPFTGRPDKNGHYGFYFGDASKLVKVMVNQMTGRLYKCSADGSYDYALCS